MDIKRLAPWNWFKKEKEKATGAKVPVKMSGSLLQFSAGGSVQPLVQLHREMDKLFENVLRGSVKPAGIRR